MLVDRATLTELAILDPGEEGASLFSLLNRASTRLGASAVKARMRALPATPELQATQESVRFLSTRVAFVQAAMTIMDPDAVDAYLGLRWQGLTKQSSVGRIFEHCTLRLRYGDAVRDIRRGVDTLQEFLEALPRLLAGIEAGSVQLKGLANGIRELLARDPIPEIRRRRRPAIPHRRS